MSMGMVCRDGGVHQFFTTGQTGHSGTSRMIQGGFLEAQTALTQQAHRHRQAHLRRAREQRRRKIVYTANVGAPNTEGIQRLKLVRRPTERNIFLDETTGESLDPSCILDAKALPPLHQHNAPVLCKAGDASQKDEAQGPKNRLEERTVHQTGHRGVFLDNNLSWTAERKIKRIDNRGKTQTDSWM
ncbi:Hypothetical protein SMAX5B_000445 [Scophthalmus maximus]|uniref:Uncharacterized protein n=2 Tax=Scophthalmus maximus TaxID=52904 RepID=A0A2U9CIY8_SCOMX|nr:Hypothetical protein SMAX5B_000445 [Scophthalmus maximus]